MDYIGYTMNICLILFMISVTGSHCQYYSNRDIILTPHQLKTYPGKILYYRPHEFTTGPGVLDNVVPAQQGEVTGTTAVPWEEVLKETVFLALNDNKTSAHSFDGSATTYQPQYIMRQQKAIYAAPYIGMVDLSVPRFGDIVELAHGRLEKESDDQYYFVQDDPGYRQESGRNISAFWKVERIRHRDDLRGHRYELKFTVAPIKDFLFDESAIVNRSFVVRDEDYPRYFGIQSPNAIPMMKKSDFIDRAIFDAAMPYHPGFGGGNRLYRPTQATITLGEYLLQSLFSSGDSSPKPNPYPPKSYRYGSGYNRIKFPETSPKYYHHIHFTRPSIAPLAPTAPPMPPLIKDLHIPAPSNVQQDLTRLVDFRGVTDAVEANSNTDNSVTTKSTSPQPQLMPNFRYPPPILAMQPTHIHHHHHLQQQPQQQPQQPQPQQQQQHQLPLQIQQQQQQPNQPQSQQQNNPPPPMQPLPPNLVQSIPIYNPQGGMMLNHIPISPNHMLQVPQAPIAIPVHVQLIPPQGQVYAPPQDGLHAVPIRIMQQAPGYIYSPVNHFLAPQHHPPAFLVPKYPNQTTHFPHHSPNSIPTTLKYSTTNSGFPFKYTPQPSTSPYVSPTVAHHRYSPLPTVQSSPAGVREKFTPSPFQPPVSSSISSSTSTPPNYYKVDPDTAGSTPIDSASPKFQSFGIENAVTPKTTTVLPFATAGDSSFTPSIGHTSSVHQGFVSNFLDDKATNLGESGKHYSEPDPLYQKSTGTTPISLTSPSPSVSSTTAAFPHTVGPNYTPKYTSHFSYKPSATLAPPQIETPISSTLKSYHYLNHDSFDFVPSRVVELAHVKKVPKKQGSKRKVNANHHHVTVTSSKPLKFSEGPDYATNRPEAQMSVQLPPPEKDYNTYYGTPKQSHKVQKPKNFVTQPYSSSTTPFPTSLTTPAFPVGFSTTPTPPTRTSASASASTSTSSLTSAITERPFTHYQPYFKNKHEKSDDIITTMRPRLIIKTVYKPYPSSSSSTTNSIGVSSTEKPLLKWIPKRPRKSNSTSIEHSASSSTSSSASIEQISAASSEQSPTSDVKNSMSLQATTRSSLENQVNRLRASRGRSRYTHRRLSTAGTPTSSQHSVKPHRIRTTTSSTTTTTTTTTATPSTTTTSTTPKPVAGVTSTVFDSNRLDQRPPTEEEDHKAEESAVAPISLKNISNEKSKRDTATEETGNEVLVAEPLISKLVAATLPTASYEMIKADIKPVETNNTNIILFEASDAASSGPAFSGRSSRLSPTLEDLTMSIINHARAIVNQTQKPQEEQQSDRTPESNEIDHRDPELPAETTVPMSTLASTSEPSIESTILQNSSSSSSSSASSEQLETTNATTVADISEPDESESDSRSETTVSVDI
ncbi:adhesive plaque matrix protein-like isoform X2 [Malaya genurostris]|uniref:adhesive plaque matrix protein-like isoform X2 n=1 Tax=Malaya genurostris TaxID=325434 RepID=UPI0026F3C762|nr:adhesive plaque matrix protein-like isoform X2 [Malaya genurostris]